MKEYMLLIRNSIGHQQAWPEDKHQLFLKACENYIGNLQAKGKLIAAQPLVREGVIISGMPDAFTEHPFNEKEEVQVGYYHILADDIKDAIAIAKQNPEFAFGNTARIEVRPVKTKEKTTGFEYPNA